MPKSKHLQINKNLSPKNNLAPDALFDFNTLSDIELLFDSVKYSVLVINASGSIVSLNKSACEVFGYTRHELLQHSVFSLFSPPTREQCKKQLKQFLSSPDSYVEIAGDENILFGYSQNGSILFLEGSLVKRRIQGEVYTLAFLKNVTQSRKEKDRLIWEATHDPVTRLISKNLMLSRIQAAVKRHKQRKQMMAILFIDLAHFHLISHIHGHEMSDKLLVAASERLLKLIHSDDTLARFDGEHFVLLCENIAHISELLQLAEQIVKAFDDIFIFENKKMFMTPHIGIRINTGQTEEMNDLLKDAEIALYKAKKSDKNHVVIFDNQIVQNIEEESSLSAQLKFAIQEHQFSFMIQPIFNRDTIVGAELLMRWKWADKSISPEKFIPIIERSYDIFTIGYWIFEQGFLIQTDWREQLNSDVTPYISINLSKRQLEDVAFYKNVKSLLNKTGADANYIILEFTEATLNEYEQSHDILLALKSLGFKIAIDDFGTGYSSIKKLKSLPIDIIKIDKCFVDKITRDETDFALLKNLINMSHLLNAKVVIKGIEKKEQYNILKNTSADEFQGFLFSNPISIIQFNENYLPTFTSSH